MSLQIKLYSAETIALSNDLVPASLAGKTRKEVITILTNDHQLRVQLNEFVKHSNNAKNARGQGRLSSPQRVKWTTIGQTPCSLCPYELIALNYLIFTGPQTTFGIIVNLALDIQNHMLKKQGYVSDRKFFSHPEYNL